MKTKHLLFGALLSFGVLATSCEKPLTDCEKTTYTSEIKTILDKNCNTSGCHDGTNERKPLTNFTESKDLTAGIVKRAITDKNMPPSAELSAADMAAITCWVDNGAKE